MAKQQKTAKTRKKAVKEPVKTAPDVQPPDDFEEKSEETGKETKGKSTNPREHYEYLLSQLTDKAARFVEEYLVDLNKQKAAERAGYSKRSAASQASTLLKQPKIIEAINEGKRLISLRNMLNQDEVLKELARVGFADITKMAGWTPEGVVLFKSSDEIPDDLRPAIAEITHVNNAKGGNTIKVKMHPKVPALLGILDRVKPGADDPQKLEITHKMTNMPPEPKDMAAWEKAYKEFIKGNK